MVVRLAGMAVLTPARPVTAGDTVGAGSPPTCDHTALQSEVAGGGPVTFNSGPAAHTIPLTSETVISSHTQIAGDLLTCVRYATGGNRWVLDHSQCGTSEVPNTIPATP